MTREKCVGEDAEKVAAYIYDAFYSQDRPGPQATAPDRAVAPDRPPVSQRRRRPGRQLPRPRPLGRAARAARRVLQSPALPQRASASSSGSTPRSGSTSATPSPDPEKFDATPVLDPLGRLGPGPGDGRVRVHRPHRARHPAVGQRHQAAADRRLGEVGQRHRVPRVALPARRPGLSAAAGVLQGQAGRGRLEEEQDQAARSRRRSRWSGSCRSGPPR